MQLKVLLLLAGIAGIVQQIEARNSFFIDLSKYNFIYYNVSSGNSLNGELEDSVRDVGEAKIAYRGLPCSCQNYTCGCCAGVNVTSLNFDRRACTNFTYDPEDASIRLAVYMNDMEIYKNAISAKNPPPICMPMPYLPAISFCIRFYDVQMRERNLKACIDFETRLVSSPVLILHFDCIRIGTSGFAWIKPEEPTNSVKPEISEPDVYDEVNFEPQDLEANINDTEPLTEDEQQIGSLKLRKSYT